jgi:hypothetical protein
MQASETSGVWGQAAKVTAPADAGTNPAAELLGVSCTSVGNCAGVGDYLDSSSHQQAMQASETSGVWGQAVKVTGPADAAADPNVTLVGVSCTSAGNCAGVGQYIDSSGHHQAMAASETSGVWGQAAKVTAPTDASTNPDADLFGVSCPSAGNCAGVGVYTDSSSRQQAMQASETSGVWGQAVKVTGPADAAAEGPILFGVSCPPAGNCAGVGRYTDSSGNQQAMAASEGTPAAGGLSPLTPSRILDTRNGTGATGPVPANGTINVQVTGKGGVPASGVGAVAINVTVTQPTASGFATVWPDGVTKPTTSNLNFVAGQTIPNLVVVPVGADGKIDLFNGGSGTSQYVGDVFGWFSSP